MDYILELIAELIVELLLNGVAKTVSDKKIPSWIRIVGIIIIISFFVIAFGLSLYFGINDNSLLLLIIASSLLFFGVIIVWNVYKSYKRHKRYKENK